MSTASRPPRVACLATDPITARFLMAGQLSFLSQCGFDVTLIAGPGEDLEVTAQRENVRVVPVSMSREITPLQDWRSLRHLTEVLRELKPDIVNAGTPKAGLLGMLAATRAQVPVRIYTLRGLRMETATGLKRLILTTTERIAARCAHKVICVSPSLRRAFIDFHLGTAGQTVVLGGGSSNGVDTKRFASTPERQAEGLALRRSLAIPDDARVIGFVGRLTCDKGVAELVAAYAALLHEFEDLHLLLVGGFEEGDPLSLEMRDAIWTHPNIHITGFVNNTAPYYSAIDLLVFPSHREGLPNVPLEAAAAGRPTAGFAATGTVDSVQHGVTGTLVPVGDIHGLTEAVRRYLTDEALLSQHGANARIRVETQFRREVIWQQLAELYNNELQQRDLPTAKRVPTPRDLAAA